MAVPSKSVSLDDYDALFDFKDFDSDLIGRYRFGPSIYRLDARATSATSFFRPKNVAEDESSKAAGSDIKSHPFSPTMHCKISKRSPSGPLSSLSSDGGYGSSSAASSPGPKDFSYFPLFDSCAESSDDCTDEEKMRSLRREASWSQYMDPSSGVKGVEVAEHWMVDMSQLFLGQKFASGTYSRLYHGLYKGKEVAVKLLRPPDEDDEVAQRLEREFRQEVSMLSRLHHQNVVQFFAACKQQGVWCIVTEYLANCSLRSFLNKNGPGSLTIKTILGMALDIGRGMEYLHSQGFIHRDLKSENLCLDKDLCVKITDFGVSCHFTERDNISKDIGTYRWMAPELYSLKPYTKKVDVYSFGIVLWELYTGLTPFQEMSAVQAAFAVVNKHSRPVIPSDCPHVLSKLMEQCWCADPNKRPDFWEIVKQLEQYEGSSS